MSRNKIISSYQIKHTRLLLMLLLSSLFVGVLVVMLVSVRRTQDIRSSAKEGVYDRDGRVCSNRSSPPCIGVQIGFQVTYNGNCLSCVEIYNGTGTCKGQIMSMYPCENPPPIFTPTPFLTQHPSRAMTPNPSVTMPPSKPTLFYTPTVFLTPTIMSTLTPTPTFQPPLIIFTPTPTHLNRRQGPTLPPVTVD